MAPAKQKRTNKGNRKHATPRRKGRKFNWVATILVLIIAAALAMLSLDPSTFYRPEPSKQRIAEPAFTKEGTLTLCRQADSAEIIRIDIEIAEHTAERIRGMMYRKSMGALTGMFFIMEREEPQSFWMRNTFVSLDILFLDRQFRIVNIHTHTEPLSSASYPSRGNARYVLEVKAGFCDRYGIVAGDFIRYERTPVTAP